ncbi:MAG: hypothetical protein HZC47_00240 [Methanobacterium sp.]|uniref:hypothetical protein n=1 Tax=Methanobacterium sp. TaxID=2164 RepID=UPI003D650A0F|nr:hypothetical protein [Methanobacterium sp.]
MKIKAIYLLIILLGMIVPVSAHGVDITPQSTIVIADNSTGIMAKKVGNEMGLNVTVYNFKSDADVSHELEHALSNSNKRILAVAYQDTVNEFLSKNPDLYNRIFVCSADEIDIKNGLTLLTANNTSGGFLTPFLAGILIGVIGGLAGGVFWMKKKIS